MFDQCFRKSCPIILQAVHLRLSRSFIRSKRNRLLCDWLCTFACFPITTKAHTTVQKACVSIVNVAKGDLLLLVGEVHAQSLVRPPRAFILSNKLPLDRCSFRVSPFTLTVTINQIPSLLIGGCHVFLLMLLNGSIVVYLMLALKPVAVSSTAIEDNNSIVRW